MTEPRLDPARRGAPPGAGRVDPDEDPVEAPAGPPGPAAPVRTEAPPGALPPVPSAQRPSSTSTERAAQGSRVSSTAPASAVLPPAIAGRLQSGYLDVSVPMRAGARIGTGLEQVTVREGTLAHVRLAVRPTPDGRGEIDPTQTLIDFRRRDGGATDLDGFLWMNPDALYIENGRLYARVPCWPDPDQTRQFFGVDRVPSDPGEFVRLLLENAQRPPTPPPPGEAPAPSVMDVVDVENLEFEIGGQFQEGPMRLGDGAVLNLAPGSSVVAHGRLRDMHARIDARVRSAQLRAGDSTVDMGRGRLVIDTGFNPLAEGGQRMGDISIRQLELESPGGRGAALSIETPAASGPPHRVSFGRLSLRGDEGGPPLLSLTTGGGDRPPTLGVRLPSIALADAQADIAVSTEGGRQTRLRFGGTDGRGARLDARVQGNVSFDSATRALSFETTGQDLSVSAEGLRLDGGPDLGFDFERVRLQGSGRIAVGSSEGRPRVEIQSQPGRELTAEVEVEDGHIGRPGHGQFSADLSTESRGRMTLRNFSYTGGDAHPVFDASAELEVTLDSLELPLPGGQRIAVRQGSRGTLRIDQAAWAAGDASPTARAQLRLDVGVDFAFDPSVMPGMEGVRAELDTQTGSTILVVDAEIDRSGEVRLAGNLQVRGARISGERLSGRVTERPEVELQEGPLRPRPRMTMATMRTHTPSAPAPARTAAAATPTMPRVRLTPSTIFGGVENLDATITMPVPAGTAAVSLPPGPVALPIGSATATPTITWPAGGTSIVTHLRAASGRLDLARSSLTFNPGVTLSIRVTEGTTGASTTFTGSVRGMRFERDPDTGEGRLTPDIVWEGVLPDWLDVSRRVGDQVGQMLFGTSRFPLDMRGAMRAMGSHLPSLGPVEFQPNLSGLGAGSSSSSGPLVPPASSTYGVDLQHATLDIRQLELARTAPLEIPLGPDDMGGQQVLRIDPPTDLRVTGTADNFTVTGPVSLGRVRLGGRELGAELDGARAELTLRVDSRTSPPRIEVELNNLSAQALTARGRLGPARGAPSATFRTQPFDGGRIVMRYGGTGASTFSVQLPRVDARVSGDGHDAGTGGARGVSGRLQGRLNLTESGVEGNFENLELDVTGAELGMAGGTQRGGLRVSGAADIVSSGGVWAIRRRGSGDRLAVSGRIELADGTQIEVARATAAEVSVDPRGSRTSVSVRDLDAEARALFSVQVERTGPPSTVDIRHARLRGNLSFDGERITSEELQLGQLDASISNLPLHLGDAFDAELEQLDLVGDYRVRFAADRSVLLEATAAQRHPDGGLGARARARRLRFRVEEPGVWMDVPGAQLQLDVRRLSLGGSRVGMRVAGGWFDGALASGGVQIAGRGSTLESVELARGTRVQGQLHNLDIGPRQTRVDATVRVDGNFGHGRRSLGQSGRVVHDDLTVGGHLRFALRAVVESARDFGAAIEMGVDADVGWRGRTRVDGEPIEVPAAPPAQPAPRTSRSRPRRSR